MGEKPGPRFAVNGKIMAKPWTAKSFCVMDDDLFRYAVAFYDFSQANFCVDSRIFDPADFCGAYRNDLK